MSKFARDMLLSADAVSDEIEMLCSEYNLSDDAATFEFRKHVELRKFAYNLRNEAAGHKNGKCLLSEARAEICLKQGQDFDTLLAGAVHFRYVCLLTDVMDNKVWLFA